MKPFIKLTTRGQIRRLRALARKALDSFPIEMIRISLIGWYTNLLFRVWDYQDKSYVLRVCAPGWRTDLDLQSEAIWLDSLRGVDHIHAPVPVASKEGEFIVKVEIAGVPGERRCMLMSFLPGVPLGRHLNEENLNSMGILFAQLHAFSLGYHPRTRFTDRKLDKVLARAEENRLFQPECLEKLEQGHQHLLLRVNQHVEKAYQRLYSNSDGLGEEGLRIIHHDLWHDNIHIHRGKLYPLDFEDTAWGYPVQDLAMALQDLMNDVEPHLYEPYAAAIRSGYESLLPWPEAYPDQIDTFRAGRILWVANYIAKYQNEHLNGYLGRIQPMLECYLETGKLRKSNLNN